MNIQSKLAVVVVTGIIGIGVVSPVFAKEGNGKVEADVDVRVETSEKAGSRPGLLRNFFTRGRAAIGSGTITAINGTTLTVKAKDGKVVTVFTDSKTQFRRRFWGKSSLSEMSVGDMVNVIGTWTDDAKTTIQARLVRDTSIQKRFGVFLGTVKSIVSGGFVMQTEKRGTLTVTIDSSTKLTNRKEQTIAQDDIAVGHKVRAKGLWDSTLHTLKEVAQVKDFSLPVQATTTATITPKP